MKRLAPLALLIACGTAQADLFVNGGFESPGPVIGQFIGPDSTAITGWTTRLSGVEYFSTLGLGGGPNPSVGPMAVDLANYVYMTGGAIEQTLVTAPGQQYDLTFYAGNSLSSGRDGTGIVKVTIDGATTSFDTAVATSATMAWKEISHSFVAASASTTVRFWNDQNPFLHFAIIDGVGATATAPVPEPGTWAMMFGGLGLLALARRR